MNTKYQEIIKLYEEGELTLEAVNKRLLEEGANFTLAPKSGKELTEQEARELAEGTIDIGREPLHLPDRPDMSRRTDLAGRTVIQQTKAGKYEVEYDEGGYARCAKKVNA